MDFRDRYGPWALIAGASMGIGAALSHEAARRGLDVVMMARGEEQLRVAATEVAEAHGVETRALVADLADPALGEGVAAAVEGLAVGLVVHNATVAIPLRWIRCQHSDHTIDTPPSRFSCRRSRLRRWWHRLRA
jgi:short-subunit dehydrogenase